MTLQHVHPGGYFWVLTRTERDACIRRIAAAVRKLVVLAGSDDGAQRLAQRLTLSGVPVLLAVGSNPTAALETYAADDVSALVTTTDTLARNGPISAPLVVHGRIARSSRDYTRRLDAVIAPAHITFVVPEDEPVAASLLPQVAHGEIVELDGADGLESILESAARDDAASVATRRRFPLTR